ncbi:MAG TPA: PP2C family protein-serine/threonine phosphatase [Streptosporangiaceae bacterium]|nr:PP2C family protein-serine/threonine phosphatase [Streptosporangiaceae bacterium]
MPGTLALVVAEPSDTVRDLDDALHADGFEVVHTTPDDLAVRPEMNVHPDLLLVSASLGLQRVALLSQRFESRAGRAPTTVVFPEGDFAELESCVRGGFDYIAPPFLPSLLRIRVSSCWERWQLTMTVEEMAAAASLREYERELSIAHEIQSGFLPEQLPTPPGWEVAARFEPAKQVGGDFYDVFELIKGQRIGFVVADVCDKGVGAALFMALIRTLVRHTAEHTGSWNLMDGGLVGTPTTEADGADRHADDGAGDGAGADDVADDVADDLTIAPMLSIAAGPLVQAVVGTNRYLARNHLRQGYFATIFFGVFDPVSGALLYINGGHNPPVLVRADGGHTMLAPTGPAVGMLSDSTYTLGHTSLEPGDTLFTYTDGVLEARDIGGHLFGMERMMDVVGKPGPTADQLLDDVDASLRRFVGSAEQADDITMLAIRRTER